jgi:hypothetical protein
MTTAETKTAAPIAIIYTDAAHQFAAAHNHLIRVISVGKVGHDATPYFDAQEAMWKSLCREIRAINSADERRLGWVYTAAKALCSEVA